VGGRFRGLLGGHSSPPMEMRATSTYRTIDSHVLGSSKLATTRILVCQLATARLLCSRPPPLYFSLRPHCQLGIYRWQRPLVARAATSHPTPPPVDSLKKIDRWNGLLGGFFGFLFLCTHGLSFSYIIFYLNVFVWLWKIGGP